MTKYVMMWDARTSGGAAENEASAKRTLAVFASWEPPAELTFHEFVARADGQGGFAVISTDDLAVAAREMAKFVPFNEFTLYPVMEIADSVGLGAEAIAFRDAVG